LPVNALHIDRKDALVGENHTIPNGLKTSKVSLRRGRQNIGSISFEKLVIGTGLKLKNTAF
jgi:hypothetical protein